MEETPLQDPCHQEELHKEMEEQMNLVLKEMQDQLNLEPKKVEQDHLDLGPKEVKLAQQD